MKVGRGTPIDLDELIDLYNSTLIGLLDKHAPTVPRVLLVKSNSSWYLCAVKTFEAHLKNYRFTGMFSQYFTENIKLTVQTNTHKTPDFNVTTFSGT